MSKAGFNHFFSFNVDIHRMTQRLPALTYFMLLLVNEKYICQYSGIDFTTGPFAGLRQACEIKEKEITMKRDGCEPAGMLDDMVFDPIQRWNSSRPAGRH